MGPKIARRQAMIELRASSKLPTRFGVFTLYGFHDREQGDAISAITIPDAERLRGRADVLTRVHSACHTGDIFSSLRCDCQAQLRAAQRLIARRRCGIIIYLPQEGRGIGLINKISAYHLQDLGMDTAEANTKLGFGHDLRNYRAAAEIVRYWDIASVALLTNNPDKVSQLERYGVAVARRVSLRAGKNQHNRFYLRVKRDKFHHDV